MRAGVLFLFLVLHALAYSQSNYAFKVTATDKTPEFFSKKFAYKSSFKDSVQAAKELPYLLNKLKQNGYLGG
jgi:hypothetical protein